jgi:hypothetical protein
VEMLVIVLVSPVFVSPDVVAVSYDVCGQFLFDFFVVSVSLAVSL